MTSSFVSRRRSRGDHEEAQPQLTLTPVRSLACLPTESIATPPARPANQHTRTNNNSAASRASGSASRTNGTPRSSNPPSSLSGAMPPASVTSSGDFLEDKSTEELNAMLMANLQRKDKVNEQLIELMEGNAPPGTDPEWLKSSRTFLTSRIEHIKQILAERGSASFPGCSQPQRAAPPSPAAEVYSPVVIQQRSTQSSAQPRRPTQRDEEPRRLPTPPTPPPPASSSARRMAPSSSSSRRFVPSLPAAAEPRAPPERSRAADDDGGEADLTNLDSGFFDDDDEALMAEIEGGGAASNRASTSRVQLDSRQQRQADSSTTVSASATSPVSYRTTLKRNHTGDSITEVEKKRVSMREQMNYVCEWAR